MKRLLLAILLCFLFVAFGASTQELEQNENEIQICIPLLINKTLSADRRWTDEYFCLVPLPDKWLGFISEILGPGAARMCEESRFSWMVISRDSEMQSINISAVVGVKSCQGRPGTLQLSGNGIFSSYEDKEILTILLGKFSSAQWHATAHSGSEDEKNLLWLGYIKIPGNDKLGDEAEYVRPSTKTLEENTTVTFFPYGRGRRTTIGALDKK